MAVCAIFVEADRLNSRSPTGRVTAVVSLDRPVELASTGIGLGREAVFTGTRCATIVSFRRV